MIGGTNCKYEVQMQLKSVLNGGLENTDDKGHGARYEGEWQEYHDHPLQWLHKRCINFKVDTAFMFLGAVLSVVVVFVTAGSFDKLRRSGRV